MPTKQVVLRILTLVHPTVISGGGPKTMVSVATMAHRVDIIASMNMETCQIILIYVTGQGVLMVSNFIHTSKEMKDYGYFKLIFAGPSIWIML